MIIALEEGISFGIIDCCGVCTTTLLKFAMLLYVSSATPLLSVEICDA